MCSKGTSFNTSKNKRHTQALTWLQRIYCKHQSLFSMLVYDFKNISYQTPPIHVPFKYCEHLPAKKLLLNLKPLKLNKLDVDHIPQHKLGQYFDQLDKMINSTIYIKTHIMVHILHQGSASHNSADHQIIQVHQAPARVSFPRLLSRRRLSAPDE